MISFVKGNEVSRNFINSADKALLQLAKIIYPVAAKTQKASPTNCPQTAYDPI